MAEIIHVPGLQPCGDQVVACSPKEVFRRGLRLVHCSKNSICELLEMSTSSADETIFNELFGPPALLANVWLDLETTNIHAARIKAEDELCLDDLLIACAFPKCYETVATFGSIFGKSSTDITAIVCPMLEKIRALQVKKIFWPQDINCITIRSVHCPICPRWSIGGEAALCYETAFSTHDDKCAWINGPFCGGRSQKEICLDGLRAKMAESGTVGIAYNSYRGAPGMLVAGQPQEMLRLGGPNGLTTTRHALMEHHGAFLDKIRQFKFMTRKFRHSHEKRRLCFEAVAVMVQRQLDHDTPKFLPTAVV